MKPLTKLSVYSSPHYDDVYLDSLVKLDNAINRLKEISSAMGPCGNWTHAESVCRDVNKLVEIANDMIYLIDKNKKQ